MNTINQHNTRGSEWRKWDLHFHTPSSYDYLYKAEDADSLIVAKLKEKEIAAIAITDHFIIDAGRINSIREKAPEITVFPGVELRTDKGATNIHVILIFPENTDLSTLQSDFEAIMLRGKAKNNGNNDRIYWDYTDIVEFANKHNALISLHTGKKTNGLDKEITNALEVGQAIKEEYAKTAHIFEIGHIRDIESYNQHVFPSVNIVKPLILCSDNHDPRDYNSNLFLWIKADPTFEGLKQILYEPEERVKIQETNPALNFEKSPFTEIQISESVEVFEQEQDNIKFEKNTIQLNNGLVSIIGGRGTGKSILIDYISAGLGQNVKNKKYTKSNKITIKRQTSLKDEPKSFVLSDNPNVQFMYICQSQIKSIVEDPQAFTKNIRETIGVTDNYIVSREYREKADKYINEYFGVVKILEADGTNSQQKKDNIDKEIKRYNDFITNITSQENKPKLENYQKHLNNLFAWKAFEERIKNQNNSIEQFQQETNANLQQLNQALAQSGVNLIIPVIDNSTTINYIVNTVLPQIQSIIVSVESEIQQTKNAFAGYTGDLATLLSDVAQYQNKVTEFQEQKKNIEANETAFATIKQNYFKELGAEIENSINAYKTEIENNWLHFKNGSGDYTTEQKKLLTDILGDDNLNVAVEINFDTDKMYQFLMQKLDGRSWNIEKLERTLNITDLASYLNFIKQISATNTFSAEINLIRSYVLDVFFRKYNEFITHNIVVTSKGKNITKLSHGQQGTIYLRLKLAANLFSKTIIYDQPEDDLDNEFIMSELVSIFSKIKKYRQVIIVSHNANLVVNADSEQVVIARNEDGILKYISGSLENPEINKQICKILEGGETAFLNREQKYGFKK